MDQNANTNTEHGEIQENTGLQNDPTGSINSENASTTFQASNSIGTTQQPDIVVTGSESLASELTAGNVVSGTTEEGATVVHREISKPAGVAQTEQLETTVTATVANKSNEAQETQFGEIQNNVNESHGLGQASISEEQLEYDDEEEDNGIAPIEKAQPQTIGESIDTGLESNIEQSNASEVAEGNNDDVVTSGGVQVSDFVNNGDTNEKGNTENAKVSGEGTALASNGCHDNSAVADNHDINNKDEPNAAKENEEGNKAAAFNNSETIEVVMANGEEEKIELDAKVSHEEQNQQYTTQEQNPNEHFDEAMDDINTLVEDVPDFKEQVNTRIPIYLRHKDVEFLLFRSENQNEPSPIFEDESSEDISLDEFFGILRTIPEFNFNLNEEIILSIPQFGGVTVTEDNVYCKDLQLSDLLDVYYKLCDCTTEKNKIPQQLDFKLTSQPRFIMKYNNLVDTIKQNRGFENILPTDHSDHEVEEEVEESRKKRKL
ncbi:hypothetical protein KGF57_002617 [Candida theae]|uniref:Reduced meiotic recombination protein 1 n=1 Tax=Candida theae TaxID=1198502 RepID=A0AAD5FYT5_9ASCO|nr:uncharacterized protein KGF57_002617 [Candida theae]KAI5958262.1 hypothetical protein KGF57_002617 [Candida theae]